MNTIAVPVMLGLLVAAFLASLYSVIVWLNRHKSIQNEYRWRIASGLCFVLMAADGAFTMRWLDTNRFTTGVSVVFILILGLLILGWGLKIRDHVRQKQSPDK